MREKSFKYWSGVSGLAGVEFALVAPVLIFILIGVVDFGMYMNMSLKMEIVARSAAQYVLQGGDINLIEEDIILPSNLNVAAGEVDSDVAYVCECADGVEVACDATCDDDDYLRRFINVSLQKNHEALISYPGLSDNINLQGHVRLQANE